MMNSQDASHSQDAFWELFEPVLFDQQRQASAQDEAEKIVKLLQIEGQAKVLDLCCGKGRHSLEFSRRDFDVIGVDRTAAYIEKARLEAERLNLNATLRVEHRVSVRSYSAVELSSLLFNCGFRNVQVYGSLDGTEYDQTAQRLVVVGQK